VETWGPPKVASFSGISVRMPSRSESDQAVAVARAWYEWQSQNRTTQKGKHGQLLRMALLVERDEKEDVLVEGNEALLPVRRGEGEIEDRRNLLAGIRFPELKAGRRSSSSERSQLPTALGSCKGCAEPSAWLARVCPEPAAENLGQPIRFAALSSDNVHSDLYELGLVRLSTDQDGRRTVRNARVLLPVGQEENRATAGVAHLADDLVGPWDRRPIEVLGEAPVCQLSGQLLECLSAGALKKDASEENLAAGAGASTSTCRGSSSTKLGASFLATAQARDPWHAVLPCHRTGSHRGSCCVGPEVERGSRRPGVAAREGVAPLAPALS
jgi:hypothetical protein